MRTSSSMLALLTFFVTACGHPQRVTTPLQPPIGQTPEHERELEPRNIAVAPPPPAPEPILTSVGKGARAPGGKLPSTSGAAVDLREENREQGAVIIFIRGYWCEHCQAQLVDMNKFLPEFQNKGYKLFGISHDTVEESVKLRNKLNLQFDLLSDREGSVIKSWGVYAPKQDLARAAVFVVEPGGKILYRRISEVPSSERPGATEVLRAIP